VLDVSEFFGEGSGGVRTYLTEKARFVEQSTHIRQAIVVPGPRDVMTQSERVRCYRLGSLPIPGQSPYRFLLDVRGSRTILAHERPDIVEVGSPVLAPWHVVSVARKLGIPLVSFFHSHVPRIVAGSSSHPGVGRRASALLAWRYLRRIDRMFARTIVSSRYAAAELAAQGIVRTSHVPLGVDLALFHPRRRAAVQRLRGTLVAGNRPLVLFAGRVAHEKRLDLLLSVWPDVARHTGAVLVFAGDGPLRPMLQSRYAHPDIRWIGFVKRRGQLADLLASADAVISPGSIETFGLTTLESLASGTPVLSAHAGGAAELVADSGGGAVFESGNPSSLRDALVTLLSSDRAALGARGRQHAERFHGWDDVFTALFGVYDDVLRREQ
jgi:alpha-1,6-mannosyltransferase